MAKMTDELIDDETLDALPDDPGMAFVLFERACRLNMRAALDQEDNGHVIQGFQLDYMHDVVAAAQHFNIPDLKDFVLPDSRDFPWRVWEQFNRKVRFFTTSYRLSAKAARSRFSVELQGQHKDRIRTLIAHLKTAVDHADMPDWRKDRLRKRIADFEKVLDGKRLNFAEAMIFVAALGAGLHGIGEGAEGVGKIIHEISIAIGQSKEVEDEIRPAIPKLESAPPIYQIEYKEAPKSSVAEDLVDGIPF
jgi:hypothetical protein